MSIQPQKLPEFVWQPHAISRALYTCSTTVRKLLAVGSSLLSVKAREGDKNIVVFSISDFFKSLGLADGCFQRKTLSAAVEAAMQVVITLQDDEKATHRITWVPESIIDWETKKITLHFNPKIAEFIINLSGKRKFDLMNMGKLQSVYAIRLYELAMSYAGFAGEDGNKKNCWYFERKISELRDMFQFSPKQYKRTNNFRTVVIDLPIKEINSADIGIQISVEYLRIKKTLIGFKFCCEYTDTIKSENKERPAVSATTETDKESEKLIAKYPELYKSFLTIEKNSPEFDFVDKNSTLREINCQARAIRALKEHLAKQKEQEKKAKASK